ncbi:MAG: RIO1 family regulatory kinase/ATPase [Minisyncoccia bacterium]|jgi:RIO kinase 1
MDAIKEVLADYHPKGYSLGNAIEVRSGKEAVVYSVQADGKRYALKVYKHPDERSFQKNDEYLEGKFYSTPSVRKAILKGNKFAKKFLHTSWVKREYSLLKHLNKLGASVPRVYDWTPTSILMEFIGDDTGPAPRLVDIQLDPSEASHALDAILQTVQIFLDAGVVHSDLSAYNVLWWQGKPYVIDFPQTIDVRQNPNTEKLLKRDIENVAKYFEKYQPVDAEGIYHAMVSKSGARIL